MELQVSISFCSQARIRTLTNSLTGNFATVTIPANGSSIRIRTSIDRSKICRPTIRRHWNKGVIAESNCQ